MNRIKRWFIFAFVCVLILQPASVFASPGLPRLPTTASRTESLLTLFGQQSQQLHDVNNELMSVPAGNITSTIIELSIELYLDYLANGNEETLGRFDISTRGNHDKFLSGVKSMITELPQSLRTGFFENFDWEENLCFKRVVEYYVPEIAAEMWRKIERGNPLDAARRNSLHTILQAMEKLRDFNTREGIELTDVQKINTAAVDRFFEAELEVIRKLDEAGEVQIGIDMERSQPSFFLTRVQSLIETLAFVHVSNLVEI